MILSKRRFHPRVDLNHVCLFLHILESRNDVKLQTILKQHSNSSSSYAVYYYIYLIILMFLDYFDNSF